VLTQDVSRAIATLIIFVLGACIGSFVNVLAYRLPRTISIVLPPSFCESCRQPIPRGANVPILAYIGLRGRCAACGASIPLRYFLTELALASAASYLYLNFAPLDALSRFLFCAALFTVALIDYEWRLIPNAITLPGIPLGILAAWWLMPEVGWKSALAGAGVGAGFLFVTGEAYMRVRGIEGIGMGDVWLLGMVGAFLGLPGALFTLFAGSIFGTLGAIALAASGAQRQPPHEYVPQPAAEVVAADSSVPATPRFLQTAIPFGPFLAVAAGIFALFQPALTNWYLSR
jgi:leader peptidase (prepilin peptidase) / N-methyltransferase